MFNLLILSTLVAYTCAIRVPTGKEPYLSPLAYPTYSILVGLSSYSNLAGPPSSYQSFGSVVNRHVPLPRTVPSSVRSHGHLAEPYYTPSYH